MKKDDASPSTPIGSTNDNSQIGDRLAAERKKAQAIWRELESVGRSWEAQAKYITDLEHERSRVNSELGTIQRAYHDSLEDFLSVVSALAGESFDTISSDPSGKPSRFDIVLAYLVFLGRLPSSPLDVENIFGNLRTREDLISVFLRCEESRNRYRRAIRYEFSGREPRMEIGPVPSKAALFQFFKNTKRVWTEFGQSEPHWSVMTDDRFKAESIERELEIFFRSGVEDVEGFQRALLRNEVDLSQLHSCLDFGCGVGRLSLALSPLFEKVHGVDISSHHLEAAKRHAHKRGVTNLNWIYVSEVQQLETLPRVDAIVTIIVLQHNPPPISTFILRTLLKRLNPGGIAYFQIPTYIKGYEFHSDRYLDAAKAQTEMEMHPIEQRTIFTICRETGMEVLEVQVDGWGKGLEGVSNTFLVRKSRA